MSQRRTNPLPWLCGGALAVNLLLVVGLVGLLGYHGVGHVWQRDLVLFELVDDAPPVLAEIHEVETRRDSEGNEKTTYRVKTGNRELTRLDFRYLDEDEIQERATPDEAVSIERHEGGNFYGFLKELKRDGELLAEGHEAVLDLLRPMLVAKAAEHEAIEEIRKDEIGGRNRQMKSLQLKQRRLELDHGADAVPQEDLAEIAEREAELQGEHEALLVRLHRLESLHGAETLTVEDATGRAVEFDVAEIVRIVVPNTQGFFARTGLAFERGWEFLWGQPRESNTEGGIFPALFGTVLMVFLMSIAAVPLGVLAALYLREYAHQGMLVRLVRVAVNNLAGVPSIVFGVFGLGFFVYLVGGSIDKLFYPEWSPTPKFGTGGILWGSLTLALLTVPVVIVATEEGLAAVPRAVREGSLALGATKFETIRNVVLPAAAPGVLTGVILATARAAGEVAPLMIVGMVKLADVPVDGQFPFLHVEQKFMHLGFHIYDLAFQSPNVEAARPMVFATAFLLVVLVVVMNLVATVVRNHLRRKYATSAV